MSTRFADVAIGSTANDLESTGKKVADILEKPIRITVAGKVNVGKTSWMRTMFADQSFGEVSDRPGQTREYPSCQFKLPGGKKPYLEWYDAPGLTCSGKIWDALRAAVPDGSMPRTDDLLGLLEIRDQYDEIERDLDILYHSKECDVILYLVDCQNAPGDGGVEEEQFRLIMMLKCPVVPIMNFVGRHIKQGKANAPAWRRMFESLGNYDALFMDAWERDRHEERHLYERLTQLFKDYPEKQSFIKYYQGRQAKLVPSWLARGSDCVASWLIDVAAFEARRKWTQIKDRKQIGRELQGEVDDAVSGVCCKRLKDLCETMKLPNVDVPAVQLGQWVSLEDGVEWKAKGNPFVKKQREGFAKDATEKVASATGMSRFLFSYNMFRKYGATVGKGAAIGTGTGMAVDVFTPTFGTATLVGTIIGTATGALLAKGSEVVFNRRDRFLSAYLTNEGLDNVVGVSLALLDHLYRRGAANDAPVTERTLRSVDVETIKGVAAKLQNRINAMGWKTKQRWCGRVGRQNENSESEYKEPASRTKFRKELATHISEVVSEMKGVRNSDDRSSLAAVDGIGSKLKGGAEYLRKVVSAAKRGLSFVER
jgi:hypothetical protein